MHQVKHGNQTGQYQFMHLQEDAALRTIILQRLRLYASAAHRGAIKRIRAALADNLAPTATTQASSPGYPYALDDTTLKGYLGELLAGLAIEHFQLFGKKEWEVPVFVFHTHSQAFNQLENWRLGRPMATATFGRTGNDCVAFRRDEQQAITDVIICEAKCSGTHDLSLVHKAHKDLSTKKTSRVILWQLREALAYAGHPQAQSWRASLDAFERQGIGVVKERDVVSYTCGDTPQAKDRKHWMSNITHDSNYTGNRPLAAIEIHLDVTTLIDQLYRDAAYWDGIHD